MEVRMSSSPGPRIKRELKTIEAMCRLYCRYHHGTPDLCVACREKLDYSLKRTEHCPFGEDKGTCRNCTIHCYRSPWKDELRTMMAWAGPRMMLHHPWLALMHSLDGLKRSMKRPERPERA